MKLKEQTSGATKEEQAIFKRLKADNKLFIYDEEDEQTDEYAHFYFIGFHEGKEVVYDTILYTLRLHHESEMFEIAEHKAAQHFPNYKKIEYEEDENGNMAALNDEEEEIGLYMAEVIMELEEEDQVKVREHVEMDLHHDLGIGLEVSLNIDKVTPQIIDRFIKDFNSDKLSLDPTLYSFQTHSDGLKV